MRLVRRWAKLTFELFLRNFGIAACGVQVVTYATSSGNAREGEGSLRHVAELCLVLAGEVLFDMD